MSINLYDEAVADKIKKWVLDPKMRVLKPDETQRLFEITLDQTNDKPLSLPLIAISRHRNIDIKNTQKQSKTYNGIRLLPNPNKLPEEEIEEIPNKSITLNVIPIKLGYQIDIYCRFMEEAVEYLRNFAFNFINYPKVSVKLPYNGVEYIHQSIINLDPSLDDNSDIKEHLFTDQFTRFTMNIQIEDAYLFSAPAIQNTLFEGAEVWVHEKNTNKEEDYIVATIDDNS